MPTMHAPSTIITHPSHQFVLTVFSCNSHPISRWSRRQLKDQTINPSNQKVISSLSKRAYLSTWLELLLKKYS